ncbi:hypothetical protein C4D60_Mb05t08050 [Musa balbisiana]|uniref:Phospholipase/carboxylesterase/thioesterase domain-containing protein n=1 Tax=Musa balbisiana TaxID=52838 RepID=A0A4S8JUJ4_MUSBA|nr:hypothetical protein C4D60_Mb05t08050 [Musa balbisiana]
MQRSPLQQQQQRVIDCSSPVEMHRGSSSYASGATRRPVEFGRSYVVRPKGRHQATIVWLHGLGDNGARYVFENLISAAFMFSPRVKT